MAAFQSPPEFLLRTALARSLVRLRSVSGGQSKLTYRAAVCQKLGQPMVVTDMERASSLDPDEVRVSVRSAGVNFADILMAQGKYQVKPPVPFVPGTEFAGDVVEVGREVTGVRHGDRVLGVHSGAGCFAEEVVASPSWLHRMPDNMPYEVGGSIMCVYATAWTALTRKANIRPGMTVLVTSAAGGVGLAAVDLAANAFGAKVIGACGSDEKCALAKAKGASDAINYTTENIRERIKDITNGKGVDIVIDNVGGDIFMNCLKSLAFEGCIVVIGFASGTIPQIPANILLIKSCKAVGLWWGSLATNDIDTLVASMKAVIELFEKGKINPHVSKQFPLSQTNEAFQYILDRKSTGKVVISCQT